MKMVGANGNVTDVPDEHVQEAFQSRKFGFLPGASVPVVSPEGQVGHVPATEAFQAYQAGARTALPKELHAAEQEAKYGGVVGAGIAASEGAARGLTVGLSDPLAVGAAHLVGGKGAAEATRQHLAGYKEAHPYASTGGEIAGAVAPILASGGAASAIEGPSIARAGVEGVNLVRGGVEAAEGAGALAKGVGAVREGVSAAGILPRGIAGAGRMAEEAAANIVGHTSESLIGRVAQNAVRRAASGSVETALFSAGQEVSEATLGDHELNGEKLLAAMGHGALLGATLGGAFGAGGQLASEGGTAVLRNMAPRLEKAAGEQMWKALDPLKKFTKEADIRAGGSAAVGRTILEEAMPKEAGIIGSAVTSEDLLPRIAEAHGRIGKEIGGLLAETKATVPVHEIFGPMHDAIQGLEKKAGFEGIANTIREYRLSLAEKLGIVTDGKVMPWAERHVIPVQALVEQRRALQDLVFRESKALDPKLRVGILRDFARSMGDTEIKAIDRAAVELGGPSGQELKALNKKYQHLSLAKEAAEDASSRMQTNRNFSLSDNMHGMGAAAGAIASGHPLGAISGPVVAMGHKLLRERGNAMAAVMLDRAASLGVIRRAAAKADKEIAVGVENLLAPKQLTSGKKISPRSFRVHDEEAEAPKERYEQHVSRIAMAAAAPKIKAEHVEQHLGPGMAAHAPMTLGALASTAQTATTFLASKIPKGHQDLRSLTPQLEKPRVADAEMDAYLKHQKVADDPLSELRTGRLSKEGVETLQKVWPKLYEQVQQSVMTKLGTMKEPPSYAQRLQLGILLKIPADPTMSADFTSAMQANFGGKGDDPHGPGGAGGHAPHLAPGPHKPIEGIAQGTQTTFGAIGAAPIDQ